MLSAITARVYVDVFVIFALYYVRVVKVLGIVIGVRPMTQVCK
jgi:hypothetical protein